MKKALKAGMRVLLWGAAVLLSAAETWLAWAWIQGTLYVRRYGGAETNPYAAEDAEIAGVIALALFPLALAALVWAVYCTARCRKEKTGKTH